MVLSASVSPEAAGGGFLYIRPGGLNYQRGSGCKSISIFR